MPSSRGEDWQPLFSYRNSLVHGETDHQIPVTSKKAYTRRRKEHAQDDDEENDDSDLDPDYRR